MKILRRIKEAIIITLIVIGMGFRELYKDVVYMIKK
jgi:multisubunit Na+/H+ antiporter MnhC subunit